MPRQSPAADGSRPRQPLELPQAPPVDQSFVDPAGRPPLATRAPGRAGWRPWTAWAAIAAGFGATIIGGMIVAIVAASMGASIEDPSPGVNIGLTCFQDICLIGAALIFATMAGRPTGGDFGLRRTALGRAIGLLLAVWVGFYAVSAIWVAALSLNERQTLPDELGVSGSTLNLVLVVVLITVVAPLGEELFFRGYFFGALRNWKGFLPAAIVTGAVFGAIHIGSSPLGFTVPLAVFGFGLCLLYERTGSLYPCIALHAANNAIALGVSQKWSWEIAPIMVGAVIASLSVAWLLARVLGERAPGGPRPMAQPAS
jgi:membrane protease YdiL (CAAX protease family)